MAELFVIEKSDQVTAVGLRGDLDTAGVAAVETRFNATVCPAGHDTLVDFAEVGFLASLGIRMLVSAARTLAGKNARMIIHSPQELVRESILAAGLDDLIGLADNADEAWKLLDG